MLGVRWIGERGGWEKLREALISGHNASMNRDTFLTNSIPLPPSPSHPPISLYIYGIGIGMMPLPSLFQLGSDERGGGGGVEEGRGYFIPSSKNNILPTPTRDPPPNPFDISDMDGRVRELYRCAGNGRKCK